MLIGGLPSPTVPQRQLALSGVCEPAGQAAHKSLNSKWPREDFAARFMGGAPLSWQVVTRHSCTQLLGRCLTQAQVDQGLELLNWITKVIKDVSHMETKRTRILFHKRSAKIIPKTMDLILWILRGWQIKLLKPDGNLWRGFPDIDWQRVIGPMAPKDLSKPAHYFPKQFSQLQLQIFDLSILAGQV